MSIENLIVALDTRRIVASEHGGTWCLAFESKDTGGKWRTVLATGLVAPPHIYTEEVELLCEDPKIVMTEGGSQRSEQGFFRHAGLEGETLRLSGGAMGNDIGCRVSLHPDGYARVELECRAAADTEKLIFNECMSHIYFVPDGKAERSSDPLDFAWLPALHKDQDHVCSDHFFRSPVAAAAAHGLYGALIPDLKVFAEHHELPHALDLRVEDGVIMEAPRLSYGICATEAEGHVFTVKSRKGVRIAAQQSFSYSFDLYFGSASPVEVAEVINRHLWNRYGHPSFSDVRPQVLPFEGYGERYAYTHELPLSVKTATIDGKPCAGLNNPMRHGANFHAWENDLNVAFGVRYYGQKWGSGELTRTASEMLNLWLSSPRNGGAFPCVYNFDTGRYEGTLWWTARCADFLDGFDTGAMGVGAWWALYWIETFGSNPDLRKAVGEYGDFLAAHQLPSGAVPTYFYGDLEPATQLYESATTGISGAVLAKTAGMLNRDDLRDAAIAAGNYTVAHIIPTLAFADFETYYSCSPKPLHAVDYWSGIKPQCNLSLQWCCDQMLALYHLDGDGEWLKWGEYLLQLLSLYQQVWDPPHRSGYLYGGFGVMNTDGEWNDGRQARFIPTYADYYRSTGKIEYLERAIAATRASFALMDIPENHRNDINSLVANENFTADLAANGRAEAGKGYAPENIHHHGIEGQSGSWTGMNWSAGGGLAGSAYLESSFGNVCIDGALRRAIPIDGVEAEIVSWNDSAIEISVSNALAALRAPFTESREIVVKFRRLSTKACNVTINGDLYKEVSAEELATGLVVEV